MKTQTFSHLLKQFLLLPLIIIFGAVTIIGTGGNGDDEGGGGTLVFTANDNIDWVALQDGDGAWSKIEPDVSGGNVYTNTIQNAAGKYGIAAHELDGNTHSIIVLQSTLAELSNIAPRPSPITYNVTVNGTNLTNSTVVSVSRSDGYIDSTITSVVLAGEAGIRDLVAIENPGFNFVDPTAGVIKRNINVNGPITLGVDIVNEVNVNSFTAHDFLVTPQPFTTNIVGYVKFVTANQTRSHGVTKGVFNSPDGYYALDSGTISSDYYSIELQDEFDNGGIESAIEIKRNNLNPNLTFDFTAVTPLTGVSADASQITGLAYSPASVIPDLVAYLTEYAQVRSSDELEISYILTPGWLGDNSTYILPDLSGVTGYEIQWSLTSGILTQTSFTASMYNVPLGVPLSMHTDWIPNLYAVQPKMRTSFIP